MSHTTGVETIRAEGFSYSLLGASSFLPVVVNGKGASCVGGDLVLLLQLTGLWFLVQCRS